MAKAYRVIVYRPKIARLFKAGGVADRWLYRVSSQMITASRKAAPARTGELSKSHRIAKGSRWGNQYQSRYTIENFSRYAKWVHDGTKGSYAGGGYLYLPAGGPGRNTVSPYRGQQFPKIRVRGVKGQAPNPWLDEACTKVSVRHGAVIIAL